VATHEGVRAVASTSRRGRSEIARNLLEDPSYVQSLKARLKAGKAPHLETLLFHYGYGKPKDTREGTGEYVLRWES
jgi:hypothetical protein